MLGSDDFCHSSGVGEQKVICVAVAELPLSICHGGGSNGIGPLAALLSVRGLLKDLVLCYPVRGES